MAQHFLLSAAARWLSPGKVARMSEGGAENVFVRLRSPQTDGKFVYPHCGCEICYDCRRSEHQPRWRALIIREIEALSESEDQVELAALLVSTTADPTELVQVVTA